MKKIEGGYKKPKNKNTTMTKNIGRRGATTQKDTKKKTARKSTKPKGSITRPKKARKISLQRKKGTEKNYLTIVLLVLIGVLLGLMIAPEPRIHKQQTLREDLTDFKMNVLDEMQHGGCTGINKYLTFTNFTSDLERMKDAYFLKYDANPTNPFGTDTILYPPAALSMNIDGLDCKTFSLWTTCLMNYYPNVECRMYAAVYDGGSGHVGYECTERIGYKKYYSQT